MSDPFVIKDSGERKAFAGGMVRDITEGKTDYGLVLDGPMFERWAIHLTKGAKKYAKRNWMKAEGEEEYERFRESALRHFMQWYRGARDEDHASAVYFNINGAEYLAEKMATPEIVKDKCRSCNSSIYTWKRTSPVHQCSNCITTPEKYESS